MPDVEIKVRENGPYKVTGPITLIDADGNGEISAIYDYDPFGNLNLGGIRINVQEIAGPRVVHRIQTRVVNGKRAILGGQTRKGSDGRGGDGAVGGRDLLADHRGGRWHLCDVAGREDP
jgi:hypothetical protein